jgi:sugar/nucleoside kinase (ribokinase family)
MAPDVLCIGAVLWDVIGRTARPMPLGSDVPGRIRRVPGGVAMNIAMTLRRLGLAPAVLTAVGRDAEGAELLAEARRLGVVTDFAHLSDQPTDRYMAIEGPEGLVAAIADAHGLEEAGERILDPLADGRLGSANAPWDGPVALDGNLTADLLAQVAASPLLARADLRVAPASPGKAERLLPLLGHPRATLYVNLQEAGLLCGAPFATSRTAAQGLVARGARRVLVTDGARDTTDGSEAALLTLPPPVVAVARVTGAGDTFMAAHLVAERAGLARPDALARALDAAALFVSGATA